MKQNYNKYELTTEEQRKENLFSYFGWEDDGTFLFFPISDGYWSAAKILLEKMEESYADKGLIDTLIYPLFFNYRHSIETYLKELFFEYGEQTNEARKKFLKLGHNLEQLWNKLEPYLSKGKEHIGSNINIDELGDYIKTINQFDSDSMLMRYPINKELKKNKTRVHFFDFINFGREMDKLCKSLRLLDDDLSRQIREIASAEEVDEFLKIFKRYKTKIDSFLLLLGKDSKKESKKRECTYNDLSRIAKKQSKFPSYQFLEEAETDLLILLNALFNSGRSVDKNTVRLGKSASDKKKEFIKLCYKSLEERGLSFGKKPEEYQINIKGKAPSILFIGISKAVSILEIESN